MEGEVAGVSGKLFTMREAPAGGQRDVSTYVSWFRWAIVCASQCQDHRYFGAFSEAILKEFYKSFSQWELETVLEYCKKAEISPNTAIPPENKTLADLSPSILLLMLSNPVNLRNPTVMQIIQSYVPTKPIGDWPLDSPPVALFLLLMDEKIEVRSWAYKQITTYTTTPMPSEQFLTAYEEVLSAATHAVTSLSPNSTLAPWSDGFTFPNDPTTLWPGYCTMIRFVPVQWLQPNKSFNIDLRKVIIAHLSDTGNRESLYLFFLSLSCLSPLVADFPEVLKAFILLLNRLGPKVWEGEGDEYPQLIFNTIKDNLAYSDALVAEQPSNDHWLMQWMESYVKSLNDLPGLHGLLPLIIQYLCEELQHERFKDVRASAICVAAKVCHDTPLDLTCTHIVLDARRYPCRVGAR